MNLEPLTDHQRRETQTNVSCAAIEIEVFDRGGSNALGDPISEIHNREDDYREITCN